MFFCCCFFEGGGYFFTWQLQNAGETSVMRVKWSLNFHAGDTRSMPVSSHICILRKWRQNAWRRMCERVFFVNLQLGTSLWASCNFITDWLLHKQFSGILSKWMPSNGYFSIWYKMLEKHLWNSFLLYLVVEILQLVPKIAVSPWYSIKEVFWKTSQNSQINTRSSHAKVLCQKKRCS